MTICWLQDALAKIYPIGNTPGRRALELTAARNERLAFQAGVFNPDRKRVLQVKVQADAPRNVVLRIRRIGFIPLPHHNTAVPDAELDCRGHVPGYVPDPLFEETTATIAPRESAAFWFSLHVSPGCPPGRRTVTVVVAPEGGPTQKMRTVITVHPLEIQPRRNFPVVQWFYNDALLDWYRLRPFEEGFWRIVEPYMRNLPAHGQDTIYAPVFTPPLDGVKSPSQLLHVTRNGRRYRFEWSAVKRYVDLARRCGIRNFEWTHFFTQWGARNAIRVYRGHGANEKLLWKPDTPALAPAYRNFLAQFFPEFHRFLQREKLLKNSFFHVSDEPHGAEQLAHYRAARGLLRELAPWLKTMDALSEIVYGREGVTDMPIPSIQVTRQFVEEGIPCFTYFCCGPRGHYLNRLIDTPLVKIRMSGWLFYRFQVRGFLHWGYNYWYRSQTRTLIDPYCESSGLAWPGWAYGDPFVVYPGPAGPIDSIRWEVFALSLQDYALLQTVGVEPNGSLLAPFRDFDDFPKSRRWFAAARRTLLTRKPLRH
jgi:hypothetical protein